MIDALYHRRRSSTIRASDNPAGNQMDTMELRKPKNHWTGVTLLLIAVAAMAVFSRSWSHPFVHDDQPVVRDNPVVQGQVPWTHVFTKPYWARDISPDPLYRPVTTASFRTDAMLAVGGTKMFHVTNSILHTFASLFVAIVAFQLTRTTLAMLSAGLIFALHPVHTEAVALIVGRSELLALLFMLAAMSVHLRFQKKASKITITHHLMMSGLYMLAVFSKEHGIFTIVAIAAIDLCGWRQMSQSKRRDRIRHLAKSHFLGMIAVLAVFFFVRWLIFGWTMKIPLATVVDTLNPLDHASSTEKLLTPLALVTLSFRLMLLPTGHSPNWGAGSFELANDFFLNDVIIGAIICLLLVLLTIRSCRLRQPALIPLITLASLLAIPCHILPVANWFFGERWLYAPSAMLALIIATVVAKSPRVLASLVILSLPILAIQSWNYQNCFSSNSALIASVLDKHPNDYFALAARCHELTNEGEIGQAEEYVERLITYHPDKGDSWCFNALFWAEHERWEDASEALSQCVMKGGHLRSPARIAELSERIAAQTRVRNDAPRRPPIR